MAWKEITKPNSLTQEERLILYDIENLAKRLEYQSSLLKATVEKCRLEQSIEGLDLMVAYSFNATQYTPQYGGGGQSLPAGKYKGIICDSSQENVAKNGMVTGGYLALVLQPVEGPHAGQKHTDRLNLHNTNAQVVEIANKQLSAYCSVVGVPTFDNTEQLYNRPFYFEIAVQKDKDGNPHPKGYTEVVALADLNGNPPGKAPASAPPAPAPSAPPAGVAPTAPAAAGWGAPAAAPAAGAPAIDSNVPAPAGWGTPAAAAPAAAPAAGWGAPTGTAPAAPPASWGPPPAA
jgi:hypothetical protein